MIEKFFLKGVRLKWDGPYDATGAPMDGTVVMNPTQPPRPMIYDGLDDELFDPGLANVSTLGLKKGMPIPYTWLSYGPGRTIRRMLSAGDVLTGYMSGCPVALWSDKGIRYVGHVGTEDSNPVANAKVRRTFAQFMPRETTGFNPFSAWPPGDIMNIANNFKLKYAGMKIIGLVTTSGQFYSILVFKLSGKLTMIPADNFCIGGIRPVPPLGYDAMKRWVAPMLGIIGTHRN